uniref:hypothetical protein n=1 Tax=Halomicronema sp. CCY15110 TaxID=2767773 RepID=UPI001952711B
MGVAHDRSVKRDTARPLTPRPLTSPVPALVHKQPRPSAYCLTGAEKFWEQSIGSLIVRKSSLSRT